MTAVKTKTIGRIAIKMPPGFRLRRFSEFLFSKRTYERVFKQQLADLEKDYIDALAEGAQGRWIRVRGVLVYGLTFAAYIFDSTFGVLLRKMIGS